MTPHDEAVEAAAEQWCRLSPSRPAEERMSISITAYLRHMRAAGFVVTRVPKAKYGWGNNLENARAYNQAIEDTLANAVEVRDE